MAHNGDHNEQQQRRKPLKKKQQRRKGSNDERRKARSGGSGSRNGLDIAGTSHHRGIHSEASGFGCKVSALPLSLVLSLQHPNPCFFSFVGPFRTCVSSPYPRFLKPKPKICVAHLFFWSRVISTRPITVRFPLDFGVFVRCTERKNPRIDGPVIK